jgi:hypothetical protein
VVQVRLVPFAENPPSVVWAKCEGFSLRALVGTLLCHTRPGQLREGSLVLGVYIEQQVIATPDGEVMWVPVALPPTRCRT